MKQETIFNIPNSVLCGRVELAVWHRDRKSFFQVFWQIKHPCPRLSHSVMAWRWDWQQQPSSWHQSADSWQPDWHARDWQEDSWWGGSSWHQDTSWEWPDDKANKDQPKTEKKLVFSGYSCSEVAEGFERVRMMQKYRRLQQAFLFPALKFVLGGR